MTVESIITHLLNTLRDPFLNLTGEEMNLECSIETLHDELIINLVAGFPTLLLEEHYKPLIQTALKAQYPNTLITIHINQWIKPHRTQMVGKGLRGVKNTIAIASGKGGVGKSTVTVNLAAALARAGARVGILDADIYGPSIPMMLGNSKPVAIQEDKYLPVQAHHIQAMSMGYLAPDDQALIWRGPMLAKSMIQMLDITLWDDLDYLLIDLPPGTGDIQLSLVQKIPLTAAIIVTTPQNVATLDAQKAIQMFAKTNIHVLGLVENMATHHCSQCGHEEAVFGSGGAEALCAKHHTLLLGQLPLNSQIRQDCDEGFPTAAKKESGLAPAFMKTALISTIELAKKPINYDNKMPKIVVE